jgi:hypothetical protein
MYKSKNKCTSVLAKIGEREISALHLREKMKPKPGSMQKEI